MAKAKQSKYRQYASKAPGDTTRYRDVYEDQQLDRSRIEAPASKASYTAFAFIGAFFVGVLCYVIVSVCSGVFSSIGGALDSATSSITNSTNTIAVSSSATGSGSGSSMEGSSIDGSDGTSGSVTTDVDKTEIDTFDQYMAFENWRTLKGYNQIGANKWSDLAGNMYTDEEIYAMYDGPLDFLKGNEYSVNVTTGVNSGTEGSDSENVVSSGVENNSVTSSAGSTGESNGTSSNGSNFDITDPMGSMSDLGQLFFPNMYNVLAFFLGALISGAIFYPKAVRLWKAQTAQDDVVDINQYPNDQHIAFPEEIQEKFDWFPDVGAHSGVQVSSLISHMMILNKGLHPVQVADRYDKDVLDENGDVEFFKGELKEDEDGEHVFHSEPMIDEKLGHALFKSAGIPKEFQLFYDTRKIPYNPGNENRNKLKGYDTVADLINKEWEFPEYEPQRPAGAYIVDTEPVNTMVLAITRVN